MQDPAARHGQVGLGRVELAIGFGERTGLTAEDGLLVEQSGLPDPLIHAATFS